ncbi:RidA family protein [Amycolatopsis pithecellobii]|uniref:RidA family protein n=1 Tax=Amycolatopsis pithecellobii TaxID=664692 RepID=A0A6N7Z7H2_9PSEU|nr:RidA family protein [Amycolatopsis pithecellobii]MTD57050.1 RidA family protein [Amycolatopsis pithecellobii]
MPRRQIIEVPGVDHGTQPFPLAVRIGNIVLTSGINGMDRATHAIPDDPAAQVACMFDNIRSVMETAGGSVDDIGQVVLTLTGSRYRALVNERWVEMFPDEHDRPARNTQFRQLGGNSVCSALVTAVLSE